MKLFTIFWVELKQPSITPCFKSIQVLLNLPDICNEFVKCVPKARVRKLKDEKTAILFTREMAARNDDVTKADEIQKKWLLMKETWPKGSKQVYGIMKGPPRHKETWWWNRGVEEVENINKLIERTLGILQDILVMDTFVIVDMCIFIVIAFLVNTLD